MKAKYTIIFDDDEDEKMHFSSLDALLSSELIWEDSAVAVYHTPSSGHQALVGKGNWINITEDAAWHWAGGRDLYVDGPHCPPMFFEYLEDEIAAWRDYHEDGHLRPDGEQELDEYYGQERAALRCARYEVKK